MYINAILEQSGLQAVKARFERLYEKRGPDDCWEWYSGRDKPEHYPTFPVQANLPKRVLLKGHMVSYALYNGDSITDGDAEHRHTCDNRLCVNPKHIVLGDRKSNAKDMTDRDRQARGIRNGAAMLTDADVLAIRASHAPQWWLAEKYGTTQPNISLIQNRVNWRHL